MSKQYSEEEMADAIADAFVKGTKWGAENEQYRIIEILQTDKAFDAVYYDEMGADGALGDLIALIREEAK